ncbi:hypothetical protein [Vibrio jasicida]|uniref:hypothetical protein n=1 Tax=Vibrio jasicida TaxID=766224 RepID=UPI000CE4B55C|nr:hypothetical protein [Vibrio jasicida]
MNKSLTLLCALFAVPCFSADYKMPEFGLDVSNTDDEWVVTASGYLQATEEWNISAEVDSTGYLELGTGYGVMLGQFYTEAFVSYGRADLFDVYDAGVFTGTALGDDWMVFANSSHEWRTSSIGKSFPSLEKTEREWKNTVGASYTPIDFIRLGYSYNYDKKLTEGGHRTNHEVRITLKPKWVEPYVKYTFGEHRVSPGSAKISEENSVELGINFNF